MSDCWLCDGNAALEEAPLRDRVRVGRRWRALVHRSGLAGWTLVVARRHVETLADLDDDEVRELGVMLRGATRALVDAVGAAKTYAVQFSEETTHLHFGVIPRMPDLDPSRRAFAVAQFNAEEPITDAERDAIAERLAAAWPT